MSRLNNNLSKYNQKGFTLIELLVVIGILAVLLSITLIAINPQRQFAQANNTKRQSDINAILNAIHQYGADNAGSLPGTLSSCTQANPCTLTNDTSVTTRVDICSVLLTTYIAGLPADPTQNNGTPITACTGTYNTGYQAYVSGNQRVTVTAPSTQIPPATAIFSVTR